VHAYAVGGTNAHLVLEEGPAAPQPAPSRPWQLLSLSARTAGALERATANLGDHLARHPDVHLADAAFTLGVGRRDFAHRRFVLCRTVEEARTRLAEPDVRTTAEAPRTRPEVAFLLRGTPGHDANGPWDELYEGWIIESRLPPPPGSSTTSR
jgi:acyl transferase domain-containing protein